MHRRLDRDSEELHYLGITDLAKLIRDKKLSPLELTHYMLDRIKKVDCQLNSYAYVSTDLAVAAAHKAENEINDGLYRGLMHGIPIAFKDNCYLRNAAIAGGLSSERTFYPEYDATVVTKLLQAGAVPLGKLRMTEGALSGYPRGEPIPINPWRKDLWAGASSSGCGVSVAAGLCFAAIGSDTGGSIRLPAMANGVVGLKPTYGRVSRYGVLPLAQSLDHIGPFTRSSIDAAVVFDAISGFDSNDSTSLKDSLKPVLEGINRGVKGLSIGFDHNYGLDSVDPQLSEAMAKALITLEELGAEVKEVSIPHWTEEEQKAWLTICIFEAFVAQRNVYPEALRGNYSDGMLKEFLDQGACISDSEYIDAMRIRDLFTRRFKSSLAGIDSLACSSGGVPFPFCLSSQYGGTHELKPLLEKIEQEFVEPANFTGMPTLSIRCGISDEGLPLTMQLISHRLDESVLFRIGHLYDEVSGWYQHHPQDVLQPI